MLDDLRQCWVPLLHFPVFTHKHQAWNINSMHIAAVDWRIVIVDFPSHTVVRNMFGRSGPTLLFDCIGVVSELASIDSFSLKLVVGCTISVASVTFASGELEWARAIMQVQGILLYTYPSRIGSSCLINIRNRLLPMRRRVK
jgi:hypothetical protein